MWHNVNFCFCWICAYVLYGLKLFFLSTALTAPGSQDGGKLTDYDNRKVKGSLRADGTE